MLLLRTKSRSVINLPLGMILMFAAFGVVLGMEASSVGPSTGAMASLGVFQLILLIMVVSELRMTTRTADELRLVWTFGVKRWSVEDHVLRGRLGGARTPILDITIIPRGADMFEGGTTVAVLGGSPKGRGQAEAIAKLLDLPLTGDLPEPGPGVTRT
jgi:hypothetical protein